MKGVAHYRVDQQRYQGSQERPRTQATATSPAGFQRCGHAQAHQGQEGEEGEYATFRPPLQVLVVGVLGDIALLEPAQMLKLRLLPLSVAEARVLDAITAVPEADKGTLSDHIHRHMPQEVSVVDG